MNSENTTLMTDKRETELESRIRSFFDLSSVSQAQEAALLDELSNLAKDVLAQSEINSPKTLESLLPSLTEPHLPDGGTTQEGYVSKLEEMVVPEVVNVASPRFVGHMTSALPFYVRPMSTFIAALNQNVVKVESSKIITGLEKQILATLHKIIYQQSDAFYEKHTQDSASTLGIFGSGGTIANLTALWCARNSLLNDDKKSDNVETIGLAQSLIDNGYRGAAVIGSELMHYSFAKSADILGIGTKNLIKIPIDANHRIDLELLQSTIDECKKNKIAILGLIGIAGTTDSGAIDPLEEMSEIAAREKIHFHVDAAWGGPICFSKKYQHLLKGIEKADSVTLDAHKQLYCPMGIGMVMLKDPFLADVIEKQAPYIIRKGAADLGKRSLEGSRSAAVLYVHATFHLLGQEGIAWLIDSGIDKSQKFAEMIKTQQNMQLLVEPHSNIILYRLIPEELQIRAVNNTLSYEDEVLVNEWNKEIQRTQRNNGHTFVSRTSIPRTVDGQEIKTVALRVVLANPLTSENDLQMVLEDQTEIASQMSA